VGASAAVPFPFEPLQLKVEVNGHEVEVGIVDGAVYDNLGKEKMEARGEKCSDALRAFFEVREGPQRSTGVRKSCVKCKALRLIIDFVLPF
jgi:predicted acylesterase/phospholipase RssA